MSQIKLPGLCSSDEADWLLWNYKLGWDTVDPDITLCFQYTVLNWIPSFFLWFCCLIYIPILRRRQSSSMKLSGVFNVFKSILIGFILLIHVINFFLAINDKSNSRVSPPAVFLQPVFSSVSSILLIYINRLIFVKAVNSSGVLFFYWLLQLITNIVIVYSRYRRIELPDSDLFRTLTATLELVLVFISFICNCFSDNSVFNDNHKTDLDENQPLLTMAMPSSTYNYNNPPCPYNKASFLSKLTQFWLTRLFFVGYRKALTFDDLFMLPKDYTCETIVTEMEYQWNKEIERVENKSGKKPKKDDTYSSQYQKLSNDDEIKSSKDFSGKSEKKPEASLLRALFHTIGYSYVLSGIYKIVYDMLTLVQPQLLGLFIGFIENPDDLLWHGFFWIGCLSLSSIVRSIILQHFYLKLYVTGMRTRTAIIGILYRKALKLSSTSRKETTVGEIVNLMAVDSQKLQDGPLYLHFIWSAPILICFTTYFLWQELGPSVIAGVILMILLIPFNGLIGIKVKKLQNRQMKMKDERIKLMNEILSGIKILKLYAWENSFAEKIREIRNAECLILRSTVYLNAFMTVSWFCTPFLVALCSFATYIISSPDNILTANKAFVSLSLFNVLNLPMSMLPNVIVATIQSSVSVRRINKFLSYDELNVDNVETSTVDDMPVKIINGSFSWGRDESAVLTNINLEVSEGKLVAVVGTVGSGKTSLVSALIGELFKISGKVMCEGSIGYVPQQAWCQNASLQDNILFSKPMNKIRYKHVLEACALLDDLKILPAGDQTEIGEKGINLSGGQKQRISLARAVYQDASVYILDDPLSAVDAHVGKHIFNQVIGPNGLLSKKTRIIVTHGLTYLPKVDKIFVMKDGQISESGTFSELISVNGPFAEFIRTYLEQEEEENVEEDSEDEARELKKELKQTISRLSSRISDESEVYKSTTSNNFMFESKKSHRRQSSVRLSKSKSALAEEAEEEMRKAKKRKLIEEEIVEIGGVKSSVFLSYIRSSTYLFSFIVGLSCFLYLCCYVGANLFLSYWTETGDQNGTQVDGSQSFYLGIYGSIGIGQTLFVFIENFALAYGTFLASKSLHNALLNSVLRAPNSFFDTTPLGRILNRIGKDIDTVDTNIPTTLSMWLSAVSGVIGSILIISISSPYFFIAMIPLALIYFCIQRFYIQTNRQLKRIDSIRRSPIYSHFQESIIGASSIRAYKVSQVFVDKCDYLTDANQMAWFPTIVSYRWLQINLEVIGSLVILLVGIIAVLTKSTMGGGSVGLAVSYSLQITQALNLMLRISCDLESNSISIERVNEYTEIEAEAAWDIKETKPNSDWPSKGEIEFSNYSVRYRPGLDLVLKNLNFKVESGEKIGIVGRTGAGKSSLALAIFRLIEPAEGTIIIDNIDISKLGLHDLRSKITIIPQDPVLFSGTMRMNLDPFNQHSDGELWSVLEMSYLKSFVTKTSEGLDYVIAESGENLSVGQRQLVCLARALLKNTKVLVLDEATAAIDLETDDLIQSSIRRQFKSCTVLTIAHRLNTIMDYDRIIVLDKGRIIESDSPQNLLLDDKTVFYSMAQSAGLV